jgi:hypothetical protein
MVEAPHFLLWLLWVCHLLVYQVSLMVDAQAHWVAELQGLLLVVVFSVRHPVMILALDGQA